MDVRSSRGGRIAVNRKKALEGIFFLLVMGLSFHTVFRGQDMKQVSAALRSLSPLSLVLSLALALFFVSAEGIMIWYLLCGMQGGGQTGRGGLVKCLSYSFIGFFYSGITPSATGGQPMQLYYMCKDRHSLPDASVVLMTVALLYKFVLVVVGMVMLLFWHGPLRAYLGEYFPLYLLGLALNVILVLLLLAIMLAPEGMKRIAFALERALVKSRILKPSVHRKEKIEQFIGGYRDAVAFLAGHKSRVIKTCLFTLLQRCSVFVLTWIIYRGFALEGADALTVALLQASVYIAVDMLPVPGAQGITEMMYRRVFGRIFTGGYLTPSLCVTRGISFYFLLIVGMAVIAANHVYRRRCELR